MKVLLLTKSNDSGHRADGAVQKALPDAEIETIFGAQRQRLPTRKSWTCEWLISYLCPWVLPRAVLDEAGDTLNFHPGPPEYPGFGCYNFALYEGVKEYGVTCHRMVAQPDTGEIVGVRRFAIPPEATVDVLQTSTHEALFNLFVEILGRIATGEALTRCADWARPPTTRRDFEALRRIPLHASANEVRRRVRAFAHPDHEGAFIELHGQRFVAPFRK